MTRDNLNNEKDFETTGSSQSDANLSAELYEQLKQVTGTAKKLFSAKKEKVCNAIPKDKIIEKASSITGKINKDAALETASKVKSAYEHFKDNFYATFSDIKASADGSTDIYCDFKQILDVAKSANLDNEYSKALITYVLLADNSLARVLDISLANSDNSKFKIVAVGNDIPIFKTGYKTFFGDLEKLDSFEITYEPSFQGIFEKDEFVPNKITVSITI